MWGLNDLGVGLVGIGLGFIAVLLTIWWRQQTFRWGLVGLFCVIAAPLLSWWSGLAFEVADYRAGCDGLCLGFSGAPIPFFEGRAAGERFVSGRFLINSLVFLVLLLIWSMVLYTVIKRLGGSRHAWRYQVLVGTVLLGAPFVLAPLYLPPPEAHVRGDPQRVAINAVREVYLYDQLAPAPVLRVGLEDVRPRSDGQPGLRVCLRLYTYLYVPVGQMYLDMTPEGVHSNNGGVVPLEESCW